MSKPTTTYDHLTSIGLRLYQALKTFGFALFALYNPGVNCRHSPTCSVYAKMAITQYGLSKGSWLALKRLLSCHPFYVYKR